MCSHSHSSYLAVRSYISHVFIPTHHLQLLGPMADNTNQLFGDYAPNTSPAYKTTPLDGLRQLFSVKHETVCSDGTPCSQYKQETVKGLVPGADLLFVALGTGERDGTFVYLGKRMQWVFENASRWHYYVVAVVLGFFLTCFNFVSVSCLFVDFFFVLCFADKCLTKDFTQNMASLNIQIKLNCLGSSKVSFESYSFKEANMKKKTHKISKMVQLLHDHNFQWSK